VIVIKQDLILDKNQDDVQSLTMVTLLSLFAKLERVMINQRTEEALAAKKAQGITLGKPKGAIQASIYDKDRERIVELLRLGLSARKICRKHLGYGHPSSLNVTIQVTGTFAQISNTTRNLRRMKVHFKQY
jgi:DNA invertase Pin-like site-specific DNA recombinase